MFKSASIRRRLLAITLFFMLPIAVLCALWAWQEQRRAATLDSALAGLDQAEALWDAYVKVAEGRNGAVTVAPEIAAGDADAAKRFTTADGPKTRRLGAGERLFLSIGRNSGLARPEDPNADFMAQVALTTIPTLINRTQNFATQAARLKAQEQFNAFDRMGFLVAAGQYKAVADRLGAATGRQLQTLSENAVAALKPAADALRRSNVALQRAGGSIAVSVNSSTNLASVDLSDFNSALADVTRASQDLWREMATFLRNDLEARAQALRLSVAAGAFLALASTALALFLAARLGAAVLREISALESGVRRLADESVDQDLDLGRVSGELSAIAAAVEHLRTRTADRIQSAIAEREAREAAERAEMIDRLQRSIGTVVEAAVEGDFNARAQDQFEDETLSRLAQGVNRLVGSVDASLTDTSRVLSAMAKADLTQHLEGERAGAFAGLQRDVNAVIGSLIGMVDRMRSASLALKDATAHIMRGARDLSDRTAQQKDEIKRSAASLENLMSDVRETAKSAQSAREEVANARNEATHGAEVMAKATASMERIRASSGRISEVIKLIDDIAFQTNLLALNASVEAARAGGEAGKSFAVVAQEVRSLATSAGSASGDVKKMIDDSLSDIEEGAQSVEAANEALTGITKSVGEAADEMAGIADRSGSQSQALTEITSYVRDLDQIASQNAALVDDTTAAIEKTGEQARRLDEIVSTFQVVTDGAAAQDASAA